MRNWREFENMLQNLIVFRMSIFEAMRIIKRTFKARKFNSSFLKLMQNGIGGFR